MVERLEFSKDFFTKSLPEATEEPLADISEPMQVDDDVLNGKKKLFLTTEKPKGIKYFKCEIIGEHTMSEQEWSDAVTKADLALQEIFGDEFCGTWDFDYDIDSYLNS